MKTLPFIAVLVVAGAVAVITTTSLRDYKLLHSAAAVASAEKFRTEVSAKAAIDDHVNMLAVDNCLSRVIIIKSQNQALKITRSSEIAAALRSDLRLCVSRGLLHPWDRDDLRVLGLLAFLDDKET